MFNGIRNCFTLDWNDNTHVLSSVESHTFWAQTMLIFSMRFNCKQIRRQFNTRWNRSLSQNLILSCYAVISKSDCQNRKQKERLIQTFVLRSCRFPLYHVMMAFGRDPLLSHLISYRRSATNCGGVSKISTFNGLTTCTLCKRNRTIKSELVQYIMQ